MKTLHDTNDNNDKDTKLMKPVSIHQRLKNYMKKKTPKANMRNKGKPK